MAIFRISEADAARDFAALLDKVRAGAEFIIEGAAAPSVVLRAAEQRPLRMLSESLRLAKEHACAATLDGEFASDLAAAIASHPEPLDDPWA